MSVFLPVPLSPPTAVTARGAGRQAGQSLGGCPAQGLYPQASPAVKPAPTPALSTPLPSAHPVGLDLAVCFPPVLLPTARLLELELQLHKLPGREELQTDKRKARGPAEPAGLLRV